MCTEIILSVQLDNIQRSKVFRKSPKLVSYCCITNYCKLTSLKKYL